MREEKKGIVQELVDEFEGANPLVFTDYTGVKAGAVADLRVQLSQMDSRYRVVQNRLFKRALDTVGLSEANDYIQGPVGVAYGGKDVVEVVKLLVKFVKDNPKTLIIKGGIVDQMSLDTESLGELAKLPPKEMLIARLVGQIGAPLSRMVMVLQGNIRNMVSVLDNICKKKAEGKEETVEAKPEAKAEAKPEAKAEAKPEEKPEEKKEENN